MRMDNRDLTAEMPKDAASEKANPDALTNLISQANASLGASAASNFVPAEQVVHPKKRKKEEKQERTPGLKAFDIFLYPFLTNFGVFAMSVAATYLTTRGKDTIDGTKNSKLVFGKFGKFMAERGEWLDKKFETMGMGKRTAEMSRTVFFSFADGTLLAPVVKLFEDKREKIGKGIDNALGTKPEDESVYKAEPKQSWLSVIGGRLATVAIVVPTAIGLNNISLKPKNGIPILDASGKEVKRNLNDLFFREQGEAVGHYLEKKPFFKKHFSNYNLPALSRVVAFEAFYTSVCTAGLYFSSRFFARKLEKKEKDEPLAQAPINTEAPAGDAKRDEVKPAPEPKTRVVPQGVASQRLTDPSVGATLA